MSQELWTAVDDYLNEFVITPDPILDEVLRANAAAGLPSIDVAPNQGKLLHLLARLSRAKLILEIGTLGGYSSIWLARALPPDGKLITLEANLKHAQVAQANFERAGVCNRIEVRLGPALESLTLLASEQIEPFDLIFIDADKANNSRYLDWAIRLSHSGTVIIVDNVVREGTILRDSPADADTLGTREMFEAVSHDARLDATAIQTVGKKKHDGFLLALVK